LSVGWFGLMDLPRLGAGRSRSVSAENPTGRKGAGGSASSSLGSGRKGNAFVPIAKGETLVIADLVGSGVIRHIWLTVADHGPAGDFLLRDLVIRMSWDGEATPSVEVPLGDFFCNGFGMRCLVNSLPIVVAPTGGMNCYWPMPFATGARITISNDSGDDVEALFFQVDYLEVDETDESAGRFHAQWRRSRSTTPGQDHVIVDGVIGQGAYVGTYLGVATLERFWWGEGEVKFFIDGDTDLPTICGTGTEDYAGGAWAFQDALGGPSSAVVTFSSPFFGYPFHANRDATSNSPYVGDAVPMHGLYRWHIPDPIHFEHDLRVTVQQIGHDGRRLFERSDDVSSVAYWYQHEPHEPFPSLPSASDRRPR
jgi:D-arabinan exo alpha-(1,3)/(1,5)-arabinofuranosidase (non-reducing end)